MSGHRHLVVAGVCCDHKVRGFGGCLNEVSVLVLMQEARFDRHFVRDLTWSRHQLEDLAHRRFVAAQRIARSKGVIESPPSPPGRNTKTRGSWHQDKLTCVQRLYPAQPIVGFVTSGFGVPVKIQPMSAIHEVFASGQVYAASVPRGSCCAFTSTYVFTTNLLFVRAHDHYS